MEFGGEQGDGSYEIVDDFIIDEWLDEKITVRLCLTVDGTYVCT